MQEPTVFRVVSGGGEVHAENLTSTQAYSIAEFLAASRNIQNVRSEPMVAPAQRVAPINVPHIVATNTPLPAIERGSERDALREAICAHLDASVRLDAANQAVERAMVFLESRQVELEAIRSTQEKEVKASGASLAAIIKAGGSTVSIDDPISRSTILDAEARRDTAKVALDQLVAEKAESDAIYRSTESAIRLAVMAVKRADVAVLVARMADLNAEYMRLSAAIDGARFSDVPMSHEAEQAMRIEPPGPGYIDAAAKVWHRYSAALRDDPDAVREDFA